MGENTGTQRKQFLPWSKNLKLLHQTKHTSASAALLPPALLNPHSSKVRRTWLEVPRKGLPIRVSIQVCSHLELNSCTGSKSSKQSQQHSLAQKQPGGKAQLSHPSPSSPSQHPFCFSRSNSAPTNLSLCTSTPHQAPNQQLHNSGIPGKAEGREVCPEQSCSSHVTQLLVKIPCSC